MQLVGFLRGGVRHVAARDGDRFRDLGPVPAFWADPHGAIRKVDTLAPIDVAPDAIVHALPDGARILCIGLNYRAHAAEGSFAAPEHPVVFGRWTASLVTDGTPVPLPIDEGLDWEGEVAAVIGTPTARVDAERGAQSVFGYAAFNDLTARRAQKLTHQWTLGKNADLSGPMGDIVTADEVGELSEGLRLTTTVNGEVMQEASTADMIFPVGEIIALVSRTLTLNPGDTIVTGTPEGVGYVRTPPRLLGAGDEVTVSIERIGSVTTPIVAPR